MHKDCGKIRKHLSELISIEKKGKEHRAKNTPSRRLKIDFCTVQWEGNIKGQKEGRDSSQSKLVCTISRRCKHLSLPVNSLKNVISGFTFCCVLKNISTRTALNVLYHLKCAVLTALEYLEQHCFPRLQLLPLQQKIY